ncbi:hypothetical protein SUGI_0434530 [Cryptomeria japonica]|nr:hypothetical protein SUGI_0434530 [Cryptomeria japonica]
MCRELLNHSQFLQEAAYCDTTVCTTAAVALVPGAISAPLSLCVYIPLWTAKLLIMVKLSDAASIFHKVGWKLF